MDLPQLLKEEACCNVIEDSWNLKQNFYRMMVFCELFFFFCWTKRVSYHVISRQWDFVTPWSLEARVGHTAVIRWLTLVVPNLQTVGGNLCPTLTEMWDSCNLQWARGVVCYCIINNKCNDVCFIGSCFTLITGAMAREMNHSDREVG